MYRIEDKASAVKEVQRLLGLNPTGNYDDETRERVIKIQNESGYDQTGITDYKTFTEILDRYNISRQSIWDSDYLFDPKFPYTKGAFDNNVSKINEAIRILLINYAYDGYPPIGNYYGDNTSDGVRFLRNIFSMDEKDEVDEKLMMRILLERNAINTKNSFWH